MPALVAVLLLIVPVQDRETIRRAQKAPYTTAVKDCDRARDLLRDNPRQAVEFLDPILADPKIKKRECLLRIELRPGTYTDWYQFFPYQYRGRARLSLAEGEEDREKAETLVRGAIRDLEESVKRGLKSSRDHLTLAKKKLEALTARSDPTPTDPEPAFRRSWEDLLNASRFRDAKDHVEAKGGFLTKEKRREYLRQTAARCRTHLKGVAADFLRSAKLLTTAADLRNMSRFDFEQNFALPSRDQLVASEPAFDWACAVRDTFAGIRGGGEGLDGLFRNAVEAVKLAEKGDSPWFHPVDRLAYSIVREGIERRAKEARNAALADRSRLRAEAESLAGRWKSFRDRVAKAAEKNPDLLKAVPARDPSALFGDFPVEAEGIDKVVADLDASVFAEDPDAELGKVEASLVKLHGAWNDLTLESRRQIATYRVVAGALRRFLEGKTVREAAWSLRELADDLREVGGPLATAKEKYGRKVVQVFEELR